MKLSAPSIKSPRVASTSGVKTIVIALPLGALWISPSKVASLEIFAFLALGRITTSSPTLNSPWLTVPERPRKFSALEISCTPILLCSFFLGFSRQF